MGWEIITRHTVLKDILPWRYRVRTILGYSSAALPSIYTGVPPAQHGHWSMWYYAPETSAFKKTKIISHLPELTIGSRNISRGIVSRIYKRFSGITNYFCIYDIPIRHLHKFDLSAYHDIYRPGAFNGIESIFDVLENRRVPRLILSWKTPAEDAFRLLLEEINGKTKRFYFWYFPDLDALLHTSGTHDEKKIAIFLARLEEQVTELYRLAGKKYREVKLYLFSDHGMTNVTDTIDLWSQIKKLPLTEFEDYVPFYDSTMARFYTFSGRARDILMKFFLSCPVGSVLSEEELKGLGAYFPDNKFGDIIYLLHPGKLINPSFMGTIPPRAMHGYHPDDKDSFAAFLSNQEVNLPLNSICDFYSIMKQDAMALS